MVQKSKVKKLNITNRKTDIDVNKKKIKENIIPKKIIKTEIKNEEK